MYGITGGHGATLRQEATSKEREGWEASHGARTWERKKNEKEETNHTWGSHSAGRSIAAGACSVGTVPSNPAVGKRGLGKKTRVYFFSLFPVFCVTNSRKSYKRNPRYLLELWRRVHSSMPWIISLSLFSLCSAPPILENPTTGILGGTC
jgi:hypothetical protein